LKIENSSLSILEGVGLSAEEAAIYQSLLSQGPQGASQLAKNTSVKRTYVYAVCKSLAKRKLVTVKHKGRASLFSPLSPDQLTLLAENQKQQALQASLNLDALLPQLKSAYTLKRHQPTITYFEGYTGVQKIYDDIIATGQDMILLRSVYDHDTPEMNTLIDRQISRQVAANIHVRTITPLEPVYTRYTYLMLDQPRLVERHITQKFHLSLHSQIIIYGRKVAVMSLKNELIGMIIDNQDIAQTLKTVFDALWLATAQEHLDITSKWDSPGPNPYTKPLPPFHKRS